MSVLVSDTSVLIDLERGGLLHHGFRLRRGFVVPDLLYERELKGYGGDQWLTLGLRVEALEPEGVERAQQFRRQRPALTVADSLALALAQRRTWTLLTGDATLRALAAEERVDCHGVLWLLDVMEQEAVADVKELFHGLSRISAHVRCRLPSAEVARRLERYSKGA